MAQEIKTVADLDEAIKEGKYAWPGGYPKYFITEDGGALDFDTVRQEYDIIKAAIEEGFDFQWRVCYVDVNWEDPDLYDDHTGDRIESAYAEPDDSPAVAVEEQKTEREREMEFWFGKNKDKPPGGGLFFRGGLFGIPKSLMPRRRRRR